MILGLSLPLLTPSEYFMSSIIILRNDVFPLECLWTQLGPSYCSQKLCFHACTLPGQTSSTTPITFCLSLLLEVWLHSTCSLKRVTILIPQTTVL
ncbi:hypothetical protein E2C01_064829 [Portunus trituberculatus]|uniref:Uncharacterized protein n=1 Tax=Portunus trituberculatus TaxID=210409 RepID=A0A5B7HMY0_PORTR|nr:hypothetical protein [Portunus trituberculatus]